MRGKSALIMCLILIAGSLVGVIGTGEVDSILTRGSFATHDSGNFSIIIDDDGGATGWDTLEFPAGEDRLYDAYFGIGTASDSVDFGKGTELQSEHDIEISTPGNYTDEEGFARFSGWSGEDFDNVNITQRTFVNDYRENTRGHSGRWMVIDYEIDNEYLPVEDLRIIQTMNVDLGASANDDSFSFIEDLNTTVISDGSTFVGMGYFSTNSNSQYYGHNGGLYGPSVYNSESAVWSQMFAPNNIDSSSTQQDWYMDITALIIDTEVLAGPVHASFIILVGNSIYDIREAYFDAVNAMVGNWRPLVADDWISGEKEFVYSYQGPIFPPNDIIVVPSSREMEGDWGDWGIITPRIVAGTWNVSFSLDTSSFVKDWGDIELYISSYSAIGSIGEDHFISYQVDNKGPDTTLSYTNTDPLGTLKLSTSVDDRGGSGVFRTYLSTDNQTFIEASSLQIDGDREDLNFYAYSVDNIGNLGPRDKLEGLFIDGTPPVIQTLDFHPDDINDKYEFPATVFLYANDEISGIDHSSVEYRYSIEEHEQESYGDWEQMTYLDGSFTGSIDGDFINQTGKMLKAQVRLSDNLGNEVQREISNLIDSINDPPQYTILMPELPYVTTTLGIAIEGNDPDGDLVTFSFEMKMGDGSWGGIPSTAIERTDENHFLIDLPNVTFEGPLYITGSAFDGIVSTPMNTESIPMDRKAPVIGIKGIPDTEWSNIVVLNLTAIDEVSGVDAIWYLDEMNGVYQLYPYDVAIISDTGSHNITVLATDNAGNTRSLELDTIKIDSFSPEIHGVQFEPQEPRVGDDFAVEFTAFDLLSLPYEKLSQQPDLYLEVNLVFGNTTIQSDNIIPVSGEENRFRALFNDPFDSPLTRGELKISFTDAAGNMIIHGRSPINVGDVIPECPLDIDYPDPVNIGQRFEVELNSEGPVILEAKYPGTSKTWIITPLKVEGDEYTYELPASYGNGDILFRVHYGEEDSEETNMTCPGEGWFVVTVNGWQDSDGDGLGDSFELLHDLDPNLVNDNSDDIDSDGLSYLEEMYNLTDPNEKDTDEDGMDDAWESEMGTLPFRKDAYEDPDDDTWTNIKEYDGETDPRDPEDHPDEIPVTPWYWIVLIIVVLLAILGYFILQLFNRRRLEDELEDAEDELEWDRNP